MVTASCVLSSAAPAQTQRTLPTGYAASKFHTEYLMQLAAGINNASAGQLKITVHANASWFKDTEIMRAVHVG